MVAVESDAERVLAHESSERLADPWETLGRLAAESEAMRTALAARVNALGGALRYTADGPGTEQLRAEVALYERAMDRSAKFADLLLKHDWQAKHLSLEAERGAKLAQAVLTGLAALRNELSAEQRDRFLVALLGALGRGPLAQSDGVAVVRGELG